MSALQPLQAVGLAVSKPPASTSSTVLVKMEDAQRYFVVFLRAKRYFEGFLRKNSELQLLCLNMVSKTQPNGVITVKQISWTQYKYHESHFLCSPNLWCNWIANNLQCFSAVEALSSKHSWSCCPENPHSRKLNCWGRKLYFVFPLVV